MRQPLLSADSVVGRHQVATPICDPRPPSKKRKLHDIEPSTAEIDSYSLMTSGSKLESMTATFASKIERLEKEALIVAASCGDDPSKLHELFEKLQNFAARYNAALERAIACMY